MEAFSTITSPGFSELVFILASDETPDILSDVAFFKTLRMLSEIRPFKLVFSLVVLSRSHRRRNLVKALRSVAAKGSLDFLDSPLAIRKADFAELWCTG